MLSALSPTTSINLSPLVGTHCRLPSVAAPRPRPTLPRLHIVTCSAPSSPIAVSSAIDWPLSASVAELSSKKRQSPEPAEDSDDRAVKSAKVVKRVRFIVPSNGKRDSKPCTPQATANIIREACHSPSPFPSPSSLSDAASDDMRSPPSPLRSVDAPSSLLSSMQGVKLRSMSPDERTPGSPPSPTSTFNDSASNPNSSASSSTSSSPQRLPPVLHLKRGNPKGLQLSLGASSFHNSTNSSTPTPTGCASPISPFFPTQTPATPSFSGGGSLGPRSGGMKGNARRPSLLSLITHPPGGASDVPPTPGPSSSYGRRHGRMRSAGSCGAPSAFPLGSVDEYASSASSGPMLSPSMSSGDSMSTPSSTPPGSSGSEREFPHMLEPYKDGPIEIVPGVWLGAEESVFHWGVWSQGASEVGVVNVAQEIDNPFDPRTDLANYTWISPRGKDKVTLTTHPSTPSHPPVAYTHLRWSHGEGGLAELPADADLRDIVDPSVPVPDAQWRFWEAIRWMEARRRAGVPVIIHCQCGVSRSATLTVAYVMTLAASGQFPELLGHLHTMQDAYDFVKARSPWIGPNVSLVFQLVEFARNLSSLLSRHVSQHGRTWETRWPTLVDIESEDAWAKRRREFGDEPQEEESRRKREEREEEARRLDEAMVERQRGRISPSDSMRA